MPNFEDATIPLVELTKKGYITRPRFRKVWGDAQNFAITLVKRIFISAPVFIFPDFELECVVQVDISDAGLGAFLA